MTAAAGLQAAGSLASSAIGYKQHREQMDFQKRMSSTAWQRGVKDMRKAGINPMAAFQQAGASTPPGSSSRVSSPTEGVSSAYMQAKVMNAQIENLATQSALNTAQANAVDQQGIGREADNVEKGERAKVWTRVGELMEPVHSALSSMRRDYGKKAVRSRKDSQKNYYHQGM